MLNPLSPMTPVDALSLTFVDVETTGLDPDNHDRICEIAILQVRGNREIARFSSLVNPQRSMPHTALAIHGITDAMLASAPSFATLLPQFQHLLQETAVVAHNAHFDMRFLRHEFQLAQQPFPSLPVIDTLALSQAWYRFPHNSLEAIARGLKIPGNLRHRALADVLTTWQIWQAFMADKGQDGPMVLAHLMHPKDSRSSDELQVLATTLHDALEHGHSLHLHYRASNAEETVRVIDPLELHYERGYGYLRAFCQLRQDERHFRFDRILELARRAPLGDLPPGTSGDGPSSREPV